MPFRLITALFSLLVMVAVATVVSAAEPVKQDPEIKGEGGAILSPLAVSVDRSSFWRRLGQPDRKALALQLASSYDPDFDISTVMSNFSLHYDHGELWDRVRVGNKEFKLEGVLGCSVRPDIRLLASVNMMAVYYPELTSPATLRPYLEAGIGVIYTDYRVEDEAYRINFNPQLGLGAVITDEKGTSSFIALRLHHISNGGLHSDNQGVNSLLFQIGRFF